MKSGREKETEMDEMIEMMMDKMSDAEKVEERAKEKYAFELAYAYIWLAEDITRWENRKVDRSGLYAVGSILGETDEEIDEDFSEYICNQLEFQRIIRLQKAG